MLRVASHFVNPNPDREPPCVLFVHPFCAISRNLTVSGSVIGNLKMTQEMLDFCGQHNITADVEVWQGSGFWVCIGQGVGFLVDTVQGLGFVVKAGKD